MNSGDTVYIVHTHRAPNGDTVHAGEVGVLKTIDRLWGQFVAAIDDTHHMVPLENMEVWNEDHRD